MNRSFVRALVLLFVLASSSEAAQPSNCEFSLAGTTFMLERQEVSGGLFRRTDKREDDYVEVGYVDAVDQTTPLKEAAERLLQLFAVRGDVLRTNSRSEPIHGAEEYFFSAVSADTSSISVHFVEVFLVKQRAAFVRYTHQVRAGDAAKTMARWTSDHAARIESELLEVRGRDLHSLLSRPECSKSATVVPEKAD